MDDNGVAEGEGRGVYLEVANPGFALNDLTEVSLEIAAERLGFAFG